ncbi:MAG: cell division protein SepF [Erysipelotrichaceae bacterium]
MSIFKNLIDKVAPYEDDDDEFEVENNDSGSYEKPKSNRKIVDAKAKIVLFEPRTFDEAEEIARHLIEGRACFVNFHRLSKEYSQRTIDFLSGVVYAQNGSLERIDANVYLCSPSSLKVAGEIDLTD